MPQPGSTQAELEALALRLAEVPGVRAARAAARAIFQAHPNAATRDGGATLDDAADQHFYAALQRATNQDPHHPRILALSHYAHLSAGRPFPAALHGGLENPDNIYRVIPVSSDTRYVLSGVRHQPAPSQVTYELMDAIPGVNGIGEQIAILMDRDMEIGPDGAFTITIDADPANGRRNHLQSTGQARALFIRDTLSDWTRQAPDRLEITRVDGPARAPRSIEQLCDDAAGLVLRFARFWNEFRDMYVKKLNHKTNTFDPPFARPGGWGFIANTHFAIADDEAFIFTAHPRAAPYHAVLIGNAWWIALDAATRTGAFNTAQSRPNADGSITYVIAAHDPGVHNWLDTGGLHSGIIQVRWQGTPASMTALADGIDGARLVKLAALQQHLPPETVWLTAAQRQAQLAERDAAYRLRFA